MSSSIDEALISISQDQLFEDPALVQFFDLMRSVIYLRSMIQECRDAAIRDTDNMDTTIVSSRIALMKLSCDVATTRLKKEFNYALHHLEQFIQQ